MSRKKIPVVNLDTGERYESSKAAGESIGATQAAVVNQLRGRCRKIRGHRFQYEYLVKQQGK